MDHVTPAGLPRVSDYTAFARRHATLLLALVGLGLLGGLGVGLTRPGSYSATASVSLTPVPVYVMPTVDELAPPEVSIDTDAQLLRSPAVLSAVGEELGVSAARSEQHLSVTASAGTHVLHVTVTGTDPERVARAADAAATALVQVRRDALGSLTLDQIRQLRFLVIAQESLLAREQARRVVVASSDDLFTSLVELQTRLDELRAARAVPAQVVVPAPDRGTADYANTEVPATSGAALGLLAGCLAGIARDRSRGLRLPLRHEEHAHAAA
ncbi:GumC domain-containing protein [Nocardioides okcheonensis]|uniref:hypothetical protein n=1 Tax=Nocardioides okcheonensis TaxID=2894081 RepID=UPI001E5ED11B|nr:hypothetical protein [Nocardioides okcheonensis]UFN46306.1 hypothetical protein LN652_08930 [Nocardioides okcheonensis]